MRGDQLVDGETGASRGRLQVRAVVARRDLDRARWDRRDRDRALAEAEGLAFSFARIEPERIEAQDHARVRGNRRSVAGRLPRVRDGAATGHDRLVDAVADLDQERALSELADARKAFTEAQKVGRTGDAAIAGQIVTNLNLGRTFAHTAEEEKRLNALTPEEISAAFRVCPLTSARNS